MIRTRPSSLTSASRRAPRRPFAAIALLLLPLTSAACADDRDEIDECVGSLLVTVPLATIPPKLRVDLTLGDGDYVVTLDECAATGRLTVEREVGQLVIQDLSFGYTPPPSFDLKVSDLGTCSGTATPVFDAAAVHVGSGYPLCSHAEVTLPARAAR